MAARDVRCVSGAEGECREVAQRCERETAKAQV